MVAERALTAIGSCKVVHCFGLGPFDSTHHYKCHTQHMRYPLGLLYRIADRGGKEGAGMVWQSVIGQHDDGIVHRYVLLHEALARRAFEIVSQ